ncbi:MAG TPA: CHAT domain-containing protein, partial [Myxococcales bacterium]|nr:CHAT domain-containing protein [Myxococcales bacterium]
MANDDLEALFARREEIDRSLQQHQRELSVMFTDIVGSTQYFEQKGDIAGMALLRRHNGMLFPVVQECSGRIIKTIGDAIMAVFDRPQDAVRCAQKMQRALEAEKRDPHQERIRIRIGAHHGRAFVTEKDVFGDTVNTAARVAHEAGGDEIVVSQHLAEALAASGGFRMQPRGSVSLKGKAEPLPLFLVSWRDAGAPEAAQSPLTPRRELPEMFSLELQRGPAGLKVAALDGDADKGTVKLYAESALSPAQLQEISNRFSAFIGGGAAGSYKERIREQGRALFDAALSDRARQKLQGSKLSYLRLELDDELVGVPWELMHDGQEFLCLRFAVGRMVAARDDASSSGRGAARAVAGHALVVSNPSGDLPAANAEGEAVAGLLRDGFDGEVKHLRGPVTRQAFAAAVKGCSLLHFAGHSEVGAVGFVLADGHFSPQELVQAVGSSAPVLVFANGCSASEGAGFTSAARGVTDVASALLRQGTQHYLGPMCAVGDADALGFALRFYEAALGGAALGEAATEARRSLVQRATHPLAFAGYLLYGDPRRPFPGRVRLQRPQTRGPGPHTPTGPAPELATPAP